MAFCGKCGTQNNAGMNFCSSCGAAMGAATEQATQPAPAAAPSGTQSAQDTKLMSILAYLLFFIPLLTGAHKTSPAVKFHTNQGTVLFIAAAIWSIACAILSTILVFIPFLGLLLIFIIRLAGIVFPILCIIGILNAVNDKMQPLPVIGSFEVIK